MTWLDEIIEANSRFSEKINRNVLPKERKACPNAIITCMDPRINLEAVGIIPFSPNGEINSQVRVIRTLGGIAENRSLLVGIHMAGFKEVAIIMHTDCGCSLAYHKIDKIIENIETSLSGKKLEAAKRIIGKPLRENLMKWLHAFEDPKQAIKGEVVRIKNSPFVPDTIVIHGLTYDLSSGSIELVVNGYET